MNSVQDRILRVWPDLEVETTKDLLKYLRKQLWGAYNEGLLKTGPDEIHRWVRTNDKLKVDDEILGGEKDFQRDPASARLVRSDGAWIHFTLRVRQEERRTLKLIAYDFEIVFPAHHSPGFLRVDLNPPDHPNADREVRSHLHPGNDDLQWPAPVMTPQEMLDFMLRRLRPRDADKPRG